MIGQLSGTILLALAAAATFLTPLQALAQAKETPQANCQTSPDALQRGPRDASGNAQLSQQLNACGGVLKAPGVGDSEMVTPAPSTGNERVIKPGALPQNANPSNGSGG